MKAGSLLITALHWNSWCSIY